MAQHTNRRLEELTRAASDVTPHQDTVADAQQPADTGNSAKKYQRCYRTTKANSTAALQHLLYAAERAKCWTGGRNEIACKQNLVWAYVGSVDDLTPDEGEPEPTGQRQTSVVDIPLSPCPNQM